MQDHARNRLARLAADRLRRAYGRRRWRRWGNAVEVLVETILSQNTSDANSSAGYRMLRRELPRWDAVADAPVEQVERWIRVSGLSRQKAPRIQAILREVRRRRGRISLEFLGRMTPPEAYEYLTAFDGVGPKTALCSLLFSFGMGVFPVDTHIYRVCRRLGLLRAGVPEARASEALAPLIPPKDRYEMHLLLVAHGRAVCRAQNPRCRECCLLGICPYGRREIMRLKRL